jgi:hypothetical protein
MITKSFKDWDSEEVELTFEVERVKNLPLLLEWLEVKDMPLPTPALEKLKEQLLDNAEGWNEDELKMFFIAPFLNMLDFYNPPHYKPFTQRTLYIKTDKVSCKGDVEYMLAQGRKNPRVPFFFLQEYKQEEQRTNDALGQLLIAMLAAQIQNTENKIDMPVYGCYILGRFWFFVVLVGKTYSVSNAYNATDEDLYKIVAILEKIRTHITRFLEKN